MSTIVKSLEAVESNCSEVELCFLSIIRYLNSAQYTEDTLQRPAPLFSLLAYYSPCRCQNSWRRSKVRCAVKSAYRPAKPYECSRPQISVGEESETLEKGIRCVARRKSGYSSQQSWPTNSDDDVRYTFAALRARRRLYHSPGMYNALSGE